MVGFCVPIESIYNTLLSTNQYNNWVNIIMDYLYIIDIKEYFYRSKTAAWHVSNLISRIIIWKYRII